MEKFKIFAWSGLSYFDFWIYVMLRKVFHINVGETLIRIYVMLRKVSSINVGETLIRILFSFYFNGVKYTLLGVYINMYVCVCIHVGSFSVIKQHVLYYKGREFLKKILYHLQFILVQGVRQRSSFIFQEDRQLIPCWLLNNLSFPRYENTSEMKLNSITIKCLVCLRVWALCML